MNLAQRLYRGNPGINFQKIWQRALAISAVAVVLCVGSLVGRGLNLGIDFEGGGVWELESAQLSVDDVRDALRPIGHDNARIQVLTSGSGVRTLRIQSGTSAFDDSEAIVDALAEAAGIEISEVSINTVGPSWGDQITAQAERALIFFFIAIAAYITIRLEWRMAIGALVAVLHDIVITVGAYSILQFQVTPATVIAFLTILGYSLYDTIVVFDKLRELTPRASVSTGMTYRDVANYAANEVVMRSVNTVITSLLPVLSMLVVGSWILGATTLEEFAIALAIGMVVGAYSSLIVAVPVVIFLKEREPHFAELKQKLAGTKPAKDRAAASPVASRGGAGATGSDGSQTSQGSTSSGTAVSAATKPPSAVKITPSGGHPPRPRKKGKRR